MNLREDKIEKYSDAAYQNVQKNQSTKNIHKPQYNTNNEKWIRKAPKNPLPKEKLD
jgi:hypothetical protein